MDQKSIFYVYVLFDHLGIPRYIGKGQGVRWKAHETNKKPMKAFIAQTMLLLGEVPKVKIRDNLTERDALIIEGAFIKAIGREPHGPLVNRNDKGSGPNSQTVKDWHASRTPEQKAATAVKTQATIAARYTPEEISARGRARALAIGTKALSERMTEEQARRSPEERSANARKAGLASAAATSKEHKTSRQRKAIASYMATTTKEQRQFRWITDGSQRKRLKNGEALPDGWTIGYGPLKSAKASSSDAHCNSIEESPTATVSPHLPSATIAR